MHEFALAKALKQTITSKYNDHSKFIVYIGQIQNIELEVFKAALSEEVHDLNISLIFQEVPAKIRCNICGYEFLYNSLGLSDDQQEDIHFLPEAIYVYVKCPKCKSNDFEVVEGRGIFIAPYN
ncbi:MAG: hydrogenase/urease maturation nickel metallochaperone HypA [Candidatus Calescibacterium sp.]|nr:hydrogenase/urease maturation nickel metallochaperone HypA [Candidatus Calescibacterium sp.]MDW8195822.1 hydrogenase/urease maturation nickel metallochaperone HypA [Candidatus Calescibacterium sp.]